LAAIAHSCLKWLAAIYTSSIGLGPYSLGRSPLHCKNVSLCITKIFLNNNLDCDRVGAETTYITMSEPAVEESNLQEDTELENDTELGENTELEGQDAEPTQTMPPSRKVGRYFSNGHTFNIGHDTWELSGKPISDKEFDNFSRAVFKCKPIKGKHKNRAVVKIWMQYVTILSLVLGVDLW
jgi:hypothetical protein